MAKYNGLAGTHGRIPAHYPQDAPIPPTGSVTLYRNLNDQQLYTVTPAGIHTVIGAGGYVLPAATALLLGGVKVGAGLSVLPDGTISVTSPGISDVPVNALFVDSFKGNDATATPGSLVNKYSTITGAQGALQAAGGGSTIIVYPGSYSISGNMWKDQVSIYCYPGALINKGTGGAMIDGSPGGNFKIFGEGTFNNTSVEGTSSIYKTGSGCTFHMEAYEMAATSGNVLDITTDSITDIECVNMLSTNNSPIKISGTGGTIISNRVKIKAVTIESRGVSSPAISQNGAFDGSLVIEATEILGSSNGLAGTGVEIVIISNSGTGEIIIKADLTSRHTAGGASTKAMVFVANSTVPAARNKFQIIGNLTSLYDIGLLVTSQRDRTDATEIFINGDITCTNNRVFDSFTAPVGPTTGVGSLIHLNGNHSSGLLVAGVMRVAEKMVLYLTGRLEGVDLGIDKLAASAGVLCKLNFQSYVIVMSGGAPTSINGSSGGDTYNVNTVLSSNVPTGGTPIVNGVAGSLDIVSASIE